MTKFVIDASAWIEYLNGSEKGRNVAHIIEDDAQDIFTSAATLAEVLSKFLRANRDVSPAHNCLSTMSTIVVLTQDMGVAAAQIHREAKKKKKDFGMLDAFVVATARILNAKIVTGDNDFEHIKEVIFV